MTLSTRDYTAMRPLLSASQDCLEINHRQLAVFWTNPGAVRLLLFNDSDLVWTERRTTRRAAIDAAFRAAERLHEV